MSTTTTEISGTTPTSTESIKPVVKPTIQTPVPTPNDEAAKQANRRRMRHLGF
jgi:hypothetical protein